MIDSIESTATSSPSSPPASRGARFSWRAFGIRTKILAPLFLLMSLSLLSSTLAFIASTATSRNRILDEQLAEESQRIALALIQSEADVLESASLLANDPEITLPLMADMLEPGGDIVLDLDRRAIVVRDRFRLDQVLILNTQNQPRVNIAAQSILNEINPDQRDRLLMHSSNSQTVLVPYRSTWLLVGRAPIAVAAPGTSDSKLLGTVYTFLNIAEALPRLRRELGLITDITFAAPPAQISGVVSSLSKDGYRTSIVPLTLGGSPVELRLRRSEQEINAIVGSGLQAMLISTSLTMVLLLAVGTVLAQSFARPIRKLARVAGQVAAGDLAARANLSHNDEIGQLGRAFDQAAVTIADLLEQQARQTGKLRAIVQSIADGVLAVDTDERILLANHAAAALLGQTPEALIGQPIATLSQVEEPGLATGLQQIVAQIRSELTDLDRLPSEEQVALDSRVVRIHSAPILVGDGVLAGAVIVLQDITEAVEADRAKNEFIATASHELRTPLTSLKGYLDLFLLTGRENLSPDQRKFLMVVLRQTNSLIQLVNDLLEIARIDRKAIRAARRWVVLRNAIDEAVTSVRTLADERKVQIVIDAEDDLPAIWIDGLHLRQILSNLLSNAVKYVYHGGRVEVRAYALDNPNSLPGLFDNLPWPHSDERSVVVEVIDNGVGIRDADQAHIFTRFFRSENPLSIEVGGTGLGLAITRSLVHLHDAQIGFHSAEGQGSRFWVRFPAPSPDLLTHTDHSSFGPLLAAE